MAQSSRSTAKDKDEAATPVVSESTTNEATQTDPAEAADALQADGNSPENAGLQADGSQPENGTAQVDGSQQGDGSEIPAGPVLHTAGTNPDETVVIGLTDELDEAAFTPAKGQETFIEVTKDVVETFFYPGTKRPAQRILFTKGQIVPRSAIEAYNVATRARQADQNALENYVDSTTLASGTAVGGALAEK